jgi:hypothetical protein
VSQPRQTAGVSLFLIGLFSSLVGLRWPGGILSGVGILSIFGGFAPSLRDVVARLPSVGCPFRILRPPSSEELPL